MWRWPETGNKSVLFEFNFEQRFTKLYRCRTNFYSLEFISDYLKTGFVWIAIPTQSQCQIVWISDALYRNPEKIVQILSVKEFQILTLLRFPVSMSYN